MRKQSHIADAARPLKQRRWDSGHLVLLVLVSCPIVLGLWFGVRWLNDRATDSYWKDLGGLAKLDWAGNVVELSYEPKQPADCSHLQDLRHSLKSLYLRGDQVTDDALAGLSDLDALEDLHLLETKIKGTGLAHLETLDQLKYLELEMPLDDQTVIPLVSLSPTIFSVDIKGTQATDAGVKGLANFERGIAELDLSHSQITDEALHLDSWTHRIKRLDISHTAITDQGLEHLQQLSQGPFKLRWLNVSKTNITDSGVPFLGAHKKMLELDISDTAITKQGLDELIKLIPSSVILARHVKK